ncbi:hypothetical protein D3C73_1123970 [compost metagenome]
MCQRFAGRHQHFISDALGARGDHAKTDTREDIGVVTLGNRVDFIFPGDRGKRATGGHQRIAFGPGNNILRRGFHARRRVRQRHDDWARTVLVHLANNFFGKQARLTGDTDQNVRLHVANHVEQRQHIFFRIPVLQVFAFLHQFGLEREQVRHFVG